MIVIPPITITPAMLTSSSIAEPDTSVGEVVWVSGTTYAVGDIRILVSTHKKYTRVSAGAGTIPPDLDLVNWVESGPTNKWAMYDVYRNTATTYTGAFSTVLTPNIRADSIAIMGMRVPDITVNVTSGGTNIYSYTATLINRNVLDYYDYFFLDFSYKDNIVLQGVPPTIDSIITISSSGTGSISSVVLGVSQYIGYTQRQHSNDALNFSVIDRDSFGNSILTPRRSVPKTSQKLIIKKIDVPRVINIRESLNAKPAVWLGLKDDSEGYFDSLLILGIYKDFTLSLDYPEFASCTLELEEI